MHNQDYMKDLIEREDLGCDIALECLYNLSTLDKRLLETLKDGDEYRSDEIAEILERDQSTAYRSLERLARCGLVYKEKQNIRNGGYFYVYSLRPLDKIKEEALECLEEWYRKMKKAIEEL